MDARSARGEAKAAKARAKALRQWYRKKRWWLAALVVLVVVVVIATSGGDGKMPKTATSATAKATTAAPGATKTLLTQSGSGTSTTATFTAPSTWTLAWSYTCSAFGSQGNFIVAVRQNPHAGTAAALEDTPVNQLGASGSGVEHYHYGGGGVYFAVNSECSWKITATG